MKIWYWQKTPIQKDAYDMSKVAATLALTQECFKDDKRYLDLFIKYASHEGAYFNVTEGDGDVFIYLPDENILIYANWN
jgi:hypothetical protein